MKRQITLALALSLAVSLIGCGNEAIPPEKIENDITETTEKQPETEFVMSNRLPDKNYNGYEFKVLTTDEVGSIRYSMEIASDEMNGDVLNDAVFKRNMLIEDRFGVKVTQLAEDMNQFISNFKASVASGDDSYDVLVAPFDQVLPICSEYCVTVDKLPYVDIEADWWDTDVIKGTALGKKAYMLSGDINVVDDTATWCMYFNKRLAEVYKTGNLYDLVKSGKWTIDTMYDFAKSATLDLDGNDKLDTNDQWGLVSSTNGMMEFLWSAGGKFGTLKNGELELTLDSTKNINILQKAYQLATDQTAILLAENNGFSTGTMMKMNASIFNNGHALFYQGLLAMSYTNYRDMEDEFGILPYPKLDEAQDKYICTSQEWTATAFTVPKTASDLERTSIILEAMSSAASVTITPAFFDTALARKYTRDDDSAEMLEIILNSKFFDVVYAMNLGQVQNLRQTMIASSDIIASTIASMKTAVKAAADEMLAN